MKRYLYLAMIVLVFAVFGVSTAAAVQAPVALQLVSVIKEISVPLLLIVASVVGGGWGVAHISRVVRAPTPVPEAPAMERVAAGLEKLTAQFQSYLVEQARTEEPRRRAFAQVEETRDKVCELTTLLAEDLGPKINDLHRWNKQGHVDRPDRRNT